MFLFEITVFDPSNLIRATKFAGIKVPNIIDIEPLPIATRWPPSTPPVRNRATAAWIATTDRRGKICTNQRRSVRNRPIIRRYVAKKQWTNRTVKRALNGHVTPPKWWWAMALGVGPRRNVTITTITITKSGIDRPKGTDNRAWSSQCSLRGDFYFFVSRYLFVVLKWTGLFFFFLSLLEVLSCIYV